MTTLHTVPKNSREEFRFTLDKYRGEDYFSIRIYYDAGEECRPTQKGVYVFDKPIG